MLKSQQRLLHADRRQKHKVHCAGVPGGVQRMQLRLVVDGPGILRRSGARGQAGHHRVKVFSAHCVAQQRRCVARIGDPQLRPGQQTLTIGQR